MFICILSRRDGWVNPFLGTTLSQNNRMSEESGPPNFGRKWELSTQYHCVLERRKTLVLTLECTQMAHSQILSARVMQVANNSESWLCSRKTTWLASQKRALVFQRCADFLLQIKQNMRERPRRAFIWAQGIQRGMWREGERGRVDMQWGGKND